MLKPSAPCEYSSPGADWYHQFGTPTSSGTKTFSLVGKVRRTGLIEVPLGMTLRQIIFDIGGGTDKPFKAVQTGGPSGGCLSAEHLDTPVDYEALKAVGSIMGSGGLIVMDSDTCVVDLAHYFLDLSRKNLAGNVLPAGLEPVTWLKRSIELPREQPSRMTLIHSNALRKPSPRVRFVVWVRQLLIR